MTEHEKLMLRRHLYAAARYYAATIATLQDANTMSGNVPQALIENLRASRIDALAIAERLNG